MTSERVIEAIRRNPEGLLLLGAGLALLLRHVGTGTDKRSQSRSPRRAGPQTESGLAAKVGETVDEMRSYVSDTAQDIGDKASEYGRTAAEKTKQAAYETRRSVERVVESHPAAVAVTGLAVGCLAAAMFPPTRLERETLGPLGRQAADAASEAGERFKNATARARDQIKEAVSDGAIIDKGLSEVAREVGNEFKSTVMGNDAPLAPGKE